MTETSSTAASPSLLSDAQRSVRVAGKLGVSLLATWTIAFGVRLGLPRFLGPYEFGVFQFADAFTTTIFVLATLGLEVYIRKEVAVRPSHASEFVGGALLVSQSLSAVILVVALTALSAAGRPPEALMLVGLLGIAQMLFNGNTLLVAVLHSSSRVSELSVVNVGAKLLWAVGIGSALALGFGLQGAGVAILCAELVRGVALAAIARRRVELRLRLDRAATFLAIRGSLPFFVTSVAQTVYARLDVSIMSFLASEQEVGWYGAAATLGGLSLMFSPIVGWVLLPLTARVASRDTDELMLLARRAIEVVLTLAWPVAVVLHLNADQLAMRIFGDSYAPSIPALRILAATFILTYVTIVYASILIRLERGWAVTAVSLGGMLISPTLNLLLVPRFLAAYGDGGAGRAAATALVITEAYTVVALCVLLGARAVDRRLGRMLTLTVLASVITFLVDRQLQSLGLLRIVVDTAIYATLVVASGAADIRGGTALLRTLRPGTAAPATPT